MHIIYGIGNKFSTNWFVGNFLQPIYKSDVFLSLQQSRFFLLILLKKYVRNMCY
jgi:hypothetical protein